MTMFMANYKAIYISIWNAFEPNVALYLLTVDSYIAFKWLTSRH
jgi:hypothetical protein